MKCRVISTWRVPCSPSETSLQYLLGHESDSPLQDTPFVALALSRGQGWLPTEQPQERDFRASEGWSCHKQHQDHSPFQKGRATSLCCSEVVVPVPQRPGHTPRQGSCAASSSIQRPGSLLQQMLPSPGRSLEAGPAPATSPVHAHAAPPCPKCAGSRSAEVTQAAQRNHSWNGAPFGDSESKAHFIAAFQIPSIVRAFPL